MKKILTLSLQSTLILNMNNKFMNYLFHISFRNFVSFIIEFTKNISFTLIHLANLQRFKLTMYFGEFLFLNDWRPLRLSELTTILIQWIYSNCILHSILNET